MTEKDIPTQWQDHPALYQALAQRSHGELLEILADLVDEFPEVQRHLAHAQLRDTGTREDLLKAISAELKQLPGIPNRDGYVDDGMNLDPLLKYLRKLLEMGHADDLVDLAPGFLRSASHRTEMEEDGESFVDLADCMNLVFEAIGACSLPPSVRMTLALNLELDDRVDLCEQGAARFWAGDFSAEDWSALADEISRRLEAMNASGLRRTSDRYLYQRLGKRLPVALQRAGREGETLATEIRKAETTKNYAPLVKRFLAAGEREQAMDWIRRGIDATRAREPFEARRLRDICRELFVEDGDWAQVAALDADGFFDDPHLSHWQRLEQSAGQLSVWPAVHETLMGFLEHGGQPPDTNTPGWPLTAPTVSIRRPIRGAASPRAELLLDIALHEGDPAQALYWYCHFRATPSSVGETRVEKLAEALADQDLEQSVVIWLELVELRIREARRHYTQGVERRLRGIRDRLVASGKEARWREIAAGLRQAHRRRGSVTAILNRLGG